MRPSSAATPQRPSSSRKRWTRDQLLRNLQIIGPLAAPLPPTLPPSPPVSRSNSPAPPPIKRKLEPPPEHDNFKRPRTNSLLSDRPKHAPSSSQPHPPHLRAPSHTPIHTTRNEPCEDGEVWEEPPIASSSRLPPQPSVAILPNTVPIRRPKRGKVDQRHHDILHDKYHNEGRMLKYSGDSRFWSTFPVTHREYRPLANPPPPNSLYHKHGGLIARLELVDALVCFAYALWNRDYARKTCFRSSWTTIEAFLAWCKAKWLAEEVIDAENAFIGLIFLIEGFIHVRKIAYMANSQLEKDISKVYDDMRVEVEAAAAKAEQALLSGDNPGLATKPQATPPMLPSPASIAPANSANSTPTTRDSGTPNPVTSTAAASQPAHLPGQTVIRGKMLPDRYRDAPLPAPVMDSMLSVTTSVGVPFVQNLKEQSYSTIIASRCMTQSQGALNLTTLRRHFPATFARVIYTSLSPTEEHEPDFEDEEGELYWPGQSITGEGLGWVCLLGKAMIKEFGKTCGYRGLDGVVPKPKPEDVVANPPPSQVPPQQRSGSTPHGHTPHGHTPHGYSNAPSSLQR
ncbi:hypothetical protein H0H81_009564 [Sphagnurus paluster]|uniref:Uncharacterized protein n=1 Tax=Sphagnurus paluster TaxID=117069 RepID=A0A9P7GKY1_9AGAR|nr:hypothetical protein H0H81_009564 [Sphagnurus paluster]